MRWKIKPETDYLFNGINKSNIDKTLERIDTMNKIIGFYAKGNLLILQYISRSRY